MPPMARLAVRERQQIVWNDSIAFGAEELTSIPFIDNDPYGVPRRIYGPEPIVFVLDTPDEKVDVTIPESASGGVWAAEAFDAAAAITIVRSVVGNLVGGRRGHKEKPFRGSREPRRGLTRLAV